jgi:hypothetical protein
MQVLRPSCELLALGFLACAFAGYILLYAAGVLTVWVSAGSRESLSLDDGITWRLAMIMFFCGALLIWRWFAKIVLSDETIVYKWIGTKALPWREVTKLHINQRAGSIVLWGPTTRISISSDFRTRKLAPLILDLVRKHSPNCVVEGAKDLDLKRPV